MLNIVGGPGAPRYINPRLRPLSHLANVLELLHLQVRCGILDLFCSVIDQAGQVHDMLAVIQRPIERAQEITQDIQKYRSAGKSNNTKGELMDIHFRSAVPWKLDLPEPPENESHEWMTDHI